MTQLTKLKEFERVNIFWKKLFYGGVTTIILYFILIKLQEWGMGLPFYIGNINTVFLSFTALTGILFFKYLIDWKKDPEFQEITKSQRVPPWLDWSYPFFPWFMGYCILRLFVYEPFVIPSGSMLPTLQIKTVVFVNKFDRVILNPLNNKAIFKVNPVERGDVLVFKYPVDEKIIYIKRAVGIPGDKLEWDYSKELLSINGQEIVLKDIDSTTWQVSLPSAHNKNVTHLQEKRKPNSNIIGPTHEGWEKAIGNENCTFVDYKLTCNIPEGYYFMMGDNRNESADSRFWGLMKEDLLIGRAAFQLDLFNFKAGKL